MDNKHSVWRMRLIIVILLIFAFLIIGRLYFVQLVKGETYSERAGKQYVRPDDNIYNRGNIYFTNKDGERISAATLKSGFTVAINPQKISDPEKVYEDLSLFLEIDKDEFMKKSSKEDDPYEIVARRVNSEIVSQIDEKEIDGIYISQEKWRYYPGDEMASRTIGFVGYKGDEQIGVYGLERYYDELLSRSTEKTYVNFFAEVFSNLGSLLNPGDEEGDLITHIEPSVQFFVEQEIYNLQEKWSSEFSGAIVINPGTGEVYSLAFYPTYNLNEFFKEEDPLIYSNPLVEGVYEMGSIIKPLTLAAGLDSGVITAETTYNDKGFLVLNEAKISNYDGKGRGVVKIQEILNQSLNTGAAFVMDQMGKEKFSEYMKNFGLGKETGIDLPGETYGLVENLNSPREIEHATASYGQGIALTPIATARALSVLGNGGLLVDPHIIKEIEYTNGYVKEYSPNPPKRVLKEETSDEITRMLVRVTDEALLEGKYKRDRYSVATKTGTAQVAKEDEGGYYDDRFMHTFFGYFPAYNPKFLVLLFTMDPKEVRYASHSLTETFMNISDFLINYYDIPPDR